MISDPKGANNMITIGKHPEMSHDELQAYWEHANRAYPDEHGTVDIEFDGEFVDLFLNAPPVKFQRIRRITGYLVGTLDRFNNAKRQEVTDRVKHFKAD
jgi:hypothetical protein